MEAVSRGAAEAGTHVIGVTCADIENWRPVGANRWVKEEIQMKSIPERILCIIEKCDGALASPRRCRDLNRDHDDVEFTSD
jgi:predicted Rossmann-fold nucleotide-binding protein